jgi:hypothetical protein
MEATRIQLLTVVCICLRVMSSSACLHWTSFQFHTYISCDRKHLYQRNWAAVGIVIISWECSLGVKPGCGKSDHPSVGTSCYGMLG